jgi:hypothetical protein
MKATESLVRESDAARHRQELVAGQTEGQADKEEKGMNAEQRGST